MCVMLKFVVLPLFYHYTRQLRNLDFAKVRDRGLEPNNEFFCWKNALAVQTVWNSSLSQMGGLSAEPQSCKQAD